MNKTITIFLILVSIVLTGCTGALRNPSQDVCYQLKAMDTSNNTVTYECDVQIPTIKKQCDNGLWYKITCKDWFTRIEILVYTNNTNITILDSEHCTRSNYAR